jgi:hypothetical protein
MGKNSFTKDCNPISFKMKSYNPFFWRKVGLVLLAGLILGQAVRAQCVGNLATRAYDTALTSNGFGVFNLNFPQFSPDSGTLVSVKLLARVNSLYGFTLRNADTLAETYSLTVGEQDEFSGSPLPAPYTHVTSLPIGNYPLTPGQSITQAPVDFLNNNLSSDSVTAVSSFLGSGLVNLRYQAFTFTNLSTINNAAYYYSAGISNTLTFSLQYLYCRSGALLATDLSGWSAIPVGPRNVQLNWAAANETTGREYIIQRGNDTHAFTNIATLPATADGSTAYYGFPDELPEDAGSNWYYRLQVLDATGQVSYSSIKEVSLTPGGKGLQVYPNPATDFINLVPDLPEATDWQVDIYAADGSLVQRSAVMQTRTMLINFSNKLSAGTYFVRALDLRGQRTISATFIVLGAR